MKEKLAPLIKACIIAAAATCCTTHEEISREPTKKSEFSKEPVVEVETIIVEAEEIKFNHEDLMKKLRSIQDSFIKEMNQFDEPRTEVGQQDGSLRRHWIRAWHAHKGSYEVNGDKYYVRNREGKPVPPQVCADLIVDTFDRMGGNWWVYNSGRHLRINQVNSFSKFIKSKDLSPRRVPDLINVMESNPDYFKLIYKREDSGVKIGKHSKSIELMSSLNVQENDIVFIQGTTPWDKTHIHWHSFFLYEFNDEKEDWIILGNSGMVAKRRLITESRRTPKRKIEYIFRATDALLSFIDEKEEI